MEYLRMKLIQIFILFFSSTSAFALPSTETDRTVRHLEYRELLKQTDDLVNLFSRSFNRNTRFQNVDHLDPDVALAKIKLEYHGWISKIEDVRRAAYSSYLEHKITLEEFKQIDRRLSELTTRFENFPISIGGTVQKLQGTSDSVATYWVEYGRLNQEAIRSPDCSHQISEMLKTPGKVTRGEY